MGKIFITKFNKMAKVYLVNPSIRPEDLLGPDSKTDPPPHVLPPLGLLSLAGNLRNKGHEVTIIDAAAEKDAQGRLMSNEDIVKRVQQGSLDYIGITSTLVSISSANNLAQKLRSAQGISSNIPIIFGGHQISAIFTPRGFFSETLKSMPSDKRREILGRFSGMSFGIIGEGERVLARAISSMEKGEDLKNLPGTVFLEDGDFKANPPNFLKDLDSLGEESGKETFPAYDLLRDPVNDYSASPMTCDSARPSISVIFSRGCPGRCTFCDSSVHGKSLRTHSPEWAFKLLKSLEENFGYRDFYVTDDQGTGNRDFMEGFCRFMEKEGKNYSLALVGRAKPFWKEALQRMKQNGAHQIAFGCESANDQILRAYKKGIKLDDLVDSIKQSQEIGLDVKGLFMVGNPFETTETLERTEKFKEEQGFKYTSTSVLTPIPGSELYASSVEDLSGEYFDGKFYMGNRLGVWLEDPNNWEEMTLWKPVWIPRTLVRERGSPEKARRKLNDFIGRRNSKQSF